MANHKVLTVGQYELLKQRVKEARNNAVCANPVVPDTAAVVKAKQVLALHAEKQKQARQIVDNQRTAEYKVVEHALEFGASKDSILTAVTKYECFVQTLVHRMKAGAK